MAARRRSRLAAVLDDEEQDRAGRFVRPVDALRYRVAHAALRTILGGHTGVAPRELRFSRSEHGKPRLLHGGPLFSLSYSGAVALVAVSSGPEVGVDIEKLRAICGLRALAQRFFTSEQARSITDQPRSNRDLGFLRIWTAMEAVLKAEGTGLADGLKGFEVRGAGPDRAAASLATAPPDRAWSVRWLAPAPMHVGAVAARGEELAVRMTRFA